MAASNDPPASSVEGEGQSTLSNTGGTERTDEYTPVFYSGTLPAGGDGTVASAFKNISLEDHRSMAAQLYSFLADPAANLMQLNADKRLMTALLAIPHTRLVKVVYGIGFGASEIGTFSPLDKKLLALFGEGGGTLGTPQVLVLEESARTKQDVIALNDETFQHTLQEKGRNYPVPLAYAVNITTPPVSIMQLVPIPAHLVLDGFASDLDAAEVYERIQAATVQDEVLAHAAAFLRAVLLKFRATHKTPFTSQATFMTMSSKEARTWATSRFSELFPGATTPGQQEHPDQTAWPLLVAQLAAHQQSATNAGTGNTEENIMSEYELRLTYKLCGFPPGESSLEHLPQWFRDVSDKKLTEHAKNMIITNAINTMIRYEDAEVPITPALLKMIRKRDWTGQDTGKYPAYANATKGLSPFALIDLSDDDVATMMTEYEALDQATSTTAAEHKK